MKIEKLLYSLVPICVASVLLIGCADLQVDNLNEPDRETVVSNPDDLQGVLQGAYGNWAWVSGSPTLMSMEVASEWATGTVANWWVNNAGHRPAEAFPNDPTASYNDVLEWPWEDYNAALASANIVVGGLDDGASVGSEADNEALRAAGHLMQGLALGHLGLFFDQAYILDEDFDPDSETAELSEYPDVIEAAVGKLDEAVVAADAAIAGGAEFPDELIPGGISLEYMQQLANSFAAKFLVMSARTEAENEAVDWDRVATYAANGIEEDFAPESDGDNWQSQILRYAYSDWIRPNMRVISLMDPSQPEDWPTDGTEVPEPETDDARYGTDYVYAPSWPIFDPDRGAFKRSHTRLERYSYHRWGIAAEGPIPLMLQAENDLLHAEALIRTGGDAGEAADLINRTRVDRGELEALDGSEDTEDLLDAIYYEFNIEIGLAGTLSVPHMTERRFGTLREGTARQWPVPASELNTIEAPLYTFGGGE